MKKTLLQICSVVGLVILLTVVTQAQTQYRANIPFDFSIGQKNFKAGEYSVGWLTPNADSKVIVIRDAKGRNSYAIMPAIASSKTETAALTFNRYADKYFLAKINTPAFKVELLKGEEMLGQNSKASEETVALTKKK